MTENENDKNLAHLAYLAQLDAEWKAMPLRVRFWLNVRNYLDRLVIWADRKATQ